jgi:hypothetical protein
MTEPRFCDCPECRALDRKHPREGAQMMLPIHPPPQAGIA